MDLNQFLTELAQRNIQLSVENDQLRFHVPQGGVLTPDLREVLVSRKAELILLLKQNKKNANKTDLPLVRIERTQSFPLSFAQERMWFLNQLEPNSSFYNEILTWQFHGSLNVVALSLSLNKIIQRHSALRTNFVIVDGQPVQVIAANLTLNVAIIDLQDVPEQEKKVQQLASAKVEEPFDIVSSPLIRATLVKLAQTEHVLLLTIHHIVFDGWSRDIFLQELATIYSAFCNNLSPELPELPIEYVDFSVWQRQSLQQEMLLSQLSYWEQQLSGAPVLFELSTDRVRQPTQTYRGACYRFSLSKELTLALVSLSQQQKVTLFMTIYAVFQTLLYRYTGQTDICVGTQIVNRDHAEIKELIGLFVNTLVLRTDISGNPSFKALLDRVRKVTLKAYAHRDLPFEKLVEKLRPERSLSYTPLVQVMLVLMNALPGIHMEGLTVSKLPVRTSTAKFDLGLFLENTDQGLTGDWVYNTDLFEPTTIALIAEHFQTLLEAVIADPETRISSIEMLTKREQHQLLWEWNNTLAEYPNHKDIQQVFESQVERLPDAVAVVFEQQQLTYRQLNAKANQLAHFLQKLGVVKERLVGICVEDSLLMAVAVLGTLKAGGAFVPLAPAYPQERLAYMLDESQALVLLTEQHLVDCLPSSNVKVVCLDSVEETISQENDCNPISNITSENLAYVIFTSGSTGKPKGILMTHEGVVSRVNRTQEIHKFTSDDRILQLGNTSFDLFIWEFFIPLLTGAKLVASHPQNIGDFDDLIRLINREQITIARFVPSILKMLLENDKFTSCNSIRRVITGGDKLTVDLVEAFISNFDIELYNQYGPSERPSSITWRCQRREKQTSIPIGRPLPNTEVYILDQIGNLTPIGVVGELHIGGPGLARGYLNKPDLTLQKFIPNPFSKKPGSRIYKTGDLARYLPDGNLEFVGRVDNQVKIRGFRIELEGIEAVLSQHPEVQQVLVISREDQQGDPRLVAYFVPIKEQVPTVKTLRSFLKQKLPDYMIPSAFVSLEAIPLSPNGKVDRHALPAPDTSNFSQSFVLPRTPTEEILAAIWIEVLGLEQVSIHDNFFEVGGHSLLATQVVSRLRQAFSLELPLRHMFELPTVAELALEIEKTNWTLKHLQNSPSLMLDNREEIEL
ncbi:MAG: amino acid adenylation domain-containing protein [Rhizonema sp. PD37]|nr:amino acid adenylation domain-containing protein [Rhizonema sp. PD37]